MKTRYKNGYTPVHIVEKRREIIWSLSTRDNYHKPADIARMFNFEHVSTITRIISKMPKGWKSPWVKAERI